MNGEYDESPQIGFGSADDETGIAVFIRVCPICGRFVKADKEVTFDGRGQPKGANATCSKHGRIEMIWIGYP